MGSREVEADSKGFAAMVHVGWAARGLGGGGLGSKGHSPEFLWSGENQLGPSKATLRSLQVVLLFFFSFLFFFFFLSFSGPHL